MNQNAFELMLSVLAIVVLVPVAAWLFDGTGFRDEASGIALLVCLALSEVYSIRKALAKGEQARPIWHPLFGFGVPAVLMLAAALLYRTTPYQMTAGILGLAAGFALVLLTTRNRHA